MGTCVSSPPNEAALVYGPRGTRIAVGSTTYRIFCFEQVDILSLELYTINVVSKAAETLKGVPINVESICQVKVHAYHAAAALMNDEQVEIEPKKQGEVNKMAIKVAAQHFVGKNSEQIMGALRDTLEGHQREILGTLTVETLYKDKAELSQKVRQHVITDLRDMGFALVSYVVKSIDDDEGYLEAIGQEATALVKRQAKEGTAKNESAAAIKVASETSNEREQVQILETKAAIEVNKAKEKEAESLRDLQLKESSYQREVAVAKAEADSAKPIEMARQKQFVVKEQVKQEAVEEDVRLGIARQRVERSKLEKEGEAEANLLAEKMDAEAIEVKAHAKGQETREIGQAEADVIRLKGQAEAEVLKAKGEAEAEVLGQKAEAFKQYGDAAVTQLIVEQLPNIAKEIAAPLAKTEKMVFISQDGHGPSAFTSDVTAMMGQLPHAVQGLTGFDMLGVAKKYSDVMSKVKEEEAEV